jgi:hypothetical protein
MGETWAVVTIALLLATVLMQAWTMRRVKKRLVELEREDGDG